MQEEFEKKVRERVHTFGIRPSHQVWDEIGAVLDKKKHHRIFVGWWILLGLAIMGGAVLFVEKDSVGRDKLNQQPLIVTDTSNNNHLTQRLPQAKREDDIAVTKTKNSTEQKQNTTTLPEQYEENTAGNKAKNDNNHLPQSTMSTIATQHKSSISFNSHLPASGNNQQAAATGKTRENVANPADVDKTNGKTLNTDTAATSKQPSNAVLNSGVDNATKASKALEDSASVFYSPTKAPLQNLSSAKQPKTMGHQKHQWFLSLSAGTTQTISPGTFNTPVSGSGIATTNSLGPSFSYIPGITALGAYKYNITPPGVGFHISAGGLYERQLSSRWKISGGIGFAYLSNTQKTGLAYNGTPTSLTSYTTDLTAQSYYQPGSTGTVVNKAWGLQVPVSISYVFNPKGKTKFMVNGGLSFAWLFRSQWLIPDTRYGKLYYNNAVFNNNALNWQAGPAVQLHNQWKFGLQYQQSFGTVAKNYIAPRLYWQNISIYTAIPLGRKKKH